MPIRLGITLTENKSDRILTWAVVEWDKLDNSNNANEDKWDMHLTGDKTYWVVIVLCILSFAVVTGVLVMYLILRK